MLENHDLWGEDPDWAKDESADDSDNDDTSTAPYHHRRILGAQHIIILIDASPTMFRKYLRICQDIEKVGVEETQREEFFLTSPFETALMAAERLVHSRIHYVATTKQGKRDGVGILLFNAPTANQEKSLGLNSFDGYDSLRTVLNLEPPGIQHLQSLRGAIQLPGREKVRDFESELYGMKLDHSLDDTHTESDDVESKRRRRAYEILVEGAWSLRSSLQKMMHMFLTAKCVKRTTRKSEDPEDQRMIFIFTNDDDPSSPRVDNLDRDQQYDNGCRELFERCNELAQDGVQIRLVALPKSDQTQFDTSLFYDNVVTKVDDVDHIFGENLSDLGVADEVDVETILDRIDIQWTKPSRYLCIPMLLPDWELSIRTSEDVKISSMPQYRIMLDIYKHIRIKKRPTPVTINSSTGSRTKKVSQIVETVSGGEVYPEHLRYYCELGDEKFRMTHQELAEIKLISVPQTGEASLILLGFKPRIDFQTIKDFPIVGSSLYAYPNESVIKGSTALLATLHTCMIQRKVMGIGELLTKKAATSSFVAIVPQEEEFDESNAQITAPGFLLISLSFDNDFRASPPSPDFDEPSEDVVRAAEELIRHQNLSNSVEIESSFSNPVLRSFWNLIESIALKKPLNDINHNDDITLDYDAVMGACGHQILTFEGLLPRDDEIPKAGKKRAPDHKEDSIEIDWVLKYREDRDGISSFEKLSNHQLRAYLKRFSIKQTGPKRDLINRVKEHIKETNDIL